MIPIKIIKKIIYIYYEVTDRHLKKGVMKILSSEFPITMAVEKQIGTLNSRTLATFETTWGAEKALTRTSGKLRT